MSHAHAGCFAGRESTLFQSVSWCRLAVREESARDCSGALCTCLHFAVPIAAGLRPCWTGESQSSGLMGLSVAHRTIEGVTFTIVFCTVYCFICPIVSAALWRVSGLITIRSGLFAEFRQRQKLYGAKKKIKSGMLIASCGLGAAHLPERGRASVSATDKGPITRLRWNLIVCSNRKNEILH